MTPDELREAVARHAFTTLQADRDTANKWEASDAYTQRTWRIIADAAIALIRPAVLDEAARVCQYQDEYDDAVSAHAELMTCARIAAAIRKLKEKT